MSHDANPTGREPAEGYAGAGSPWAAPPEPDEPGAAEAGGPTRARASVPQVRGSASVQPPQQRPMPPDEHGGWPEEQGRPGPFPPAGPPPAQYGAPPVPSAPPHAGTASVPARPTGSAQVPGAPPSGHAQVSPPTGSFPGFSQPPVNESVGGYGRPAGSAAVPDPYGASPEYGQPNQAYGQPAQPYGQSQQPYGPEYGQPNQPYGQPTGVYGAPSGGYPSQGPTGYQPGQPTNVYGTPSGPPALGYGDATAQVSGQPDTFPPAPQHKNKRLLLVLALVAAVVVLAGIGTAVTLALGGSSTNFAVNDCVKESSGKAVKADCSDSKAFRVINKVSQQSDCADKNQPYVVVQRKGSKDEVLCLRPASQK